MYKKCECCGKTIVPFRGGLQSAAIRYCNSYCWQAATTAKTNNDKKQPLISERGR